MPTFRLERYCCCCKLHIGALIIGWVSVIYTVISLIGSIYQLCTIASTVNEIQDLHNQMLHEHSRNSHFGKENYFNIQSKEQKEVTDMFARIMYGIYIAVIIMGLMNLIPDILLIIGIQKRNGKYLIPWLSIRGLQYVVCIIILLIIVFGFLPTSFVGIILMFAAFAFIIYHWLVIYSLCLNYFDNNDNHHTHNMLPQVAMKI